jgi:hypothetical protein
MIIYDHLDMTEKKALLPHLKFIFGFRMKPLWNLTDCLSHDTFYPAEFLNGNFRTQAGAILSFGEGTVILTVSVFKHTT